MHKELIKHNVNFHEKVINLSSHSNYRFSITTDKNIYLQFKENSVNVNGI